MSKFKVGDIVVGTTYAGGTYNFTTNEAEMEVIEIFMDDTMRVKILNHTAFPFAVGNRHRVSQEHFEYLNQSLENE